MSWFKRTKSPKTNSAKVDEGERKVRTEGLWQKCDGCRQIIWKKDLESNCGRLPEVRLHFRIDAVTRLKLLLTTASTKPTTPTLHSVDPLAFVDSKPYSSASRACSRRPISQTPDLAPGANWTAGA